MWQVFHWLSFLSSPIHLSVATTNIINIIS